MFQSYVVIKWPKKLILIIMCNTLRLKDTFKSLTILHWNIIEKQIHKNNTLFAIIYVYTIHAIQILFIGIM